MFIKYLVAVFITTKKATIRKQIEKPIVVITAVYNAENYIDKCIRSVAAQDYENYRMIIINDASTDRTAERD